MISDQKISKKTLDKISISPPSEVYKWATTLVIAPHPDDEMLRCGGAIALLRLMGYRVHVMVLSDGFKTLPHAEKYSRHKSRGLRQNESIRALSLLGVSHDFITFLNLNDSLIPGKGQAGFDELVRLFRNKVNDLLPDTILTPWRRDIHTDHRAAWQITHQAVDEERRGDIHLVEYSTRALNGDNAHHMPTIAEVNPWRLDTRPVIEQKLAALSVYQSQNSYRPNSGNGFDKSYSSEMLAHFTHPWELYLDQQAPY